MPIVLVAYATKHGSTREVAEAVSGALRAEGVQVGFRPARDVRGPISDRDLVVLGVCVPRISSTALTSRFALPAGRP
jgi:menaquinone-dependent protoporphyrinogen oxidase